VSFFILFYFISFHPSACDSFGEAEPPMNQSSIKKTEKKIQSNPEKGTSEREMKERGSKY
jgi:hypothetical protein